MPPLVQAAVSFMIAALTFYTIGVWSAALSRRLRPWHAAMFWLGFAADTTGTDIMRRMAGGLQWGFHTVTGALALLLMLGHAIWATTVLIRRQEAQLRTFHRLSVVVWGVWLVPFVTGMIMGARRGA
jgi:uncharacterized repeat protein (TIGR03987 family)